ncbi:MAG TPA: hypothetical protein VLL75_14510 [Vicinamibacteria bacterium]|nr:hypothetical protein [Vicinamibacteria bacterium]
MILDRMRAASAEATPAGGAAALRCSSFAARGRPTPSVTASMVVALTGGPALPDHDGLVRALTDPDGMFGMPADAVSGTLTLGGPAEVAARIADYGEAGAERVVVTLAAGDWMRQAELLAEAGALLG